MLSARAVSQKGWKAISVHPTVIGWDHAKQERVAAAGARGHRAKIRDHHV
jgi:hypothetical protein